MNEKPVAAVCGRDHTGTFPDGRMGCGEPIDTCAEVFRCTDCTVPFHRSCAKRHFEKSNENLHEQIGSLTLQLAAALRERDEAREAWSDAASERDAIVGHLATAVEALEWYARLTDQGDGVRAQRALAAIRGTEGK